MNILFLCSATSWGGNEKWTLAAASGLAQKGHRVRLGVASTIFEEHGAAQPLEIVPYRFSGKYDFRTALRLKRDILRDGVQVVVPTKQREYFLGGLAARLAGAKVAARLGIDRPIRGWRNRLAFNRFFDRVIVNSRSIVDVLASSKGFDPAKCRVVYNGVPIPTLDSGARQRVREPIGIGEDRFLIVGVGRLTSQKGFDRAIEAFALLSENLEPARLMLVGEGSDLDSLRQLAESKGVADRVLFTGFRNDVTEILQASDLFWLTSRSEGLPNVLLEAMAAQTACAAFDVAGVRELLPEREAGIVVPDGDVRALAEESLRLAAESGLRDSLARQARLRAGEIFSPQAMVEAMEQVLGELCVAPLRS